MDCGDQDFGSGCVALLDPTYFNGTGIARTSMATGKNGKIYFMNADNLGAYEQGLGHTDGIFQTIVLLIALICSNSRREVPKFFVFVPRIHLYHNS